MAHITLSIGKMAKVLQKNERNQATSQQKNERTGVPLQPTPNWPR